MKTCELLESNSEHADLLHELRRRDSVDAIIRIARIVSPIGIEPPSAHTCYNVSRVIIQHINDLIHAKKLDNAVKSEIKDSLVKFTLNWVKSSDANNNEIHVWLAMLRYRNIDYPEFNVIRKSLDEN